MDCPVLCLGEVLVDCLAEQPGAELAQVSGWTAHPGGAPANVACALAKLGTPSAFIGCVGDDATGQELLRTLQKAGTDCQGVQVHPTATTRQVLVLRSQSGDRSFAGFGAAGEAGFADENLRGAALLPQQFARARLLVMGTLGLAAPQTAAAIERALTLAKASQVEVVLDVNWRPVFWPNPAAAPGIIRQILPQVRWLKLAKEEADWLFEMTDPGAIAAQYPQLKGVLITDGDQGCAYWLGGHSGHVPAFAVDVEDTTGAGDGFLAGFLHQLVSQPGPLQTPELARQLVVYASAVGALTTMQLGAIAAQPTAQEIDAFLYLRQSS